MMWFGQEWEVAYDPKRVSLLKAGPELRHDTRQHLVALGYQEVVADGRGGGLWRIDATRLQMNRLDRLSRDEPSPQEPDLGLP